LYAVEVTENKIAKKYDNFEEQSMINSQQVLGKLIVHTQLVTQSQIKGKMNE